MKHPFIIFGSIGTLLIVGASVWIFFFLVYVPAPKTIALAPNPFVEGDATSGFEKIPEVHSAAEATSTTPYSLHHITTRKVVGAVAMNDGSYRFVEAGTGHVYEINARGIETRLSNTTFAQAQKAAWSTIGNRVAISRETETGTETFVGTLAPSDAAGMVLDGAILAGGSSNIAFSSSGDTLFYTKKTPSGLSGISRNLKTNKELTLFSIPLQEVTVSWEPHILIVTKASAELPGYAYRSDLTRVSESIPALTAHTQGDSTVFSGRVGTTLVSWIRRGKDTISLTQGVIPQKCAFQGDTLLCAVPKNFESMTYPDAWYRGETSYDDTLWMFNVQDGTGKVIVDLNEIAKKTIDVSEIVSDATGFHFIDKTESGLWHITLE